MRCLDKYKRLSIKTEVLHKDLLKLFEPSNEIPKPFCVNIDFINTLYHFVYIDPFSVGMGEGGGGGFDSRQAEIANVPYFETKKRDGALYSLEKFYFRVEPSRKVSSPQFFSGYCTEQLHFALCRSDTPLPLTVALCQIYLHIFFIPINSFILKNVFIFD